MYKPHATVDVSILSVLCEIFADFVFVEYWIRALHADPTLFSKCIIILFLECSIEEN